MPNPLRNHIAKLAAEAKSASARMPSLAAAPPQPAAPAAPLPKSASFADSISRWYDDPEAEIVASLRAQKQYPVPEYGLYGSWSAEDAVAKRPIREATDSDGLKDHVRGMYSPAEGNRGTVVVNPKHAANSPSIIDHELTHALTLPPRSGFLEVVRQQHAYDPVWDLGDVEGDPAAVRSKALAELRGRQIRGARAKGGEEMASRVPQYDSGQFDSFFDYVGRRGEIDPRLGEVRRRYTQATGNTVRTPDDARQAWEWWQSNAPDWQFVEPGQRPTMDLIESRFLDALPDETKSVLFRRMTHIPAFAAPIATGGLLGGLTSRSEEQR